ncbi:MAG: hypothetical protein KL863_11590 [Rhizobium sp.]|nr:hypothetical protein [Rhizobium sp.]
MDRKTGRPIISLKFKAPSTDAEQPAGKSTEPAQKPPAAQREPFVLPKVSSRKQGVREVVMAKPLLAPATRAKPGSKAVPKSEPQPEAKPVPIPPAAFKSATRAATEAVSAVLADPAWQSADLQRSYHDAKLRAQPIHRKQAKLISGIVLKRLAPDLDEGETKSLAMRAAYAAAFSILAGQPETATG